ncbi:HDOD domain-containing protein [Photobacterium gaetbulicola]|uniref:Signal transduction protein n=1 Tax=Photobacterium gaetbulicola Gung47 TaxID=658445 RepID=A0A0C5W8T4_9GAMM|nr:HDOD domain-containing protein [Photobacterium gaetbulicola]AJR07976.1 signal transduction protein [Photobacterium gaetbulicola Gung47]PSU07805.1 HDOD domain-containing protein [Photobacterium gaetbulicola]
MNSYLARQPVLNREKDTIGYELLFRDGPKNSFPEIGDEQATHRLLTDNFLSSGNNEVTSGKKAFINFPHSSLINRIPLLFPKKSFIIEILETCQPNDELLEAVKELHHAGYTLALDDFTPTPEWNRFIPFVHIIKFDLRVMPIAKAGFFIRRHRDKGSRITFLAEKVETNDEFMAASDAGFDLFQGYFFSRPEIVRKKALKPSALTTLRLYREISRPEVNFSKVEKIIATDVTLSYKLLHHVNNMTYTRAKPISSFKQALVYLGEEKLRRFVTFVATSHAVENKPESLYFLSLQRARFSEQLSQQLKVNIDSNQAFLTGLFSLLDCILDQPIEALIDQLPLDTPVQHALINRQGHLGGILRLAIAYDQADWKTINRLCQALNINESVVAQTYLESLKWVTVFEQTLPSKP